MTRYIAYSTASMSALAEGESTEQAHARATRGGVNTPNDDQFLIVAAYDGAEPLEHLDDLPASARIVWRGANDSAQRFRA